MIVVKPEWKAVQKRFIVFCAVLFTVPVLFLLAMIFSQRQDIQNDPPYGLVAVAFCVAFLGSLDCGWVFRYRRITFDGKRLSYRKYCFTLKSIPVEELSSVEFISGSKKLYRFCIQNTTRSSTRYRGRNTVLSVSVNGLWRNKRNFCSCGNLSRW